VLLPVELSELRAAEALQYLLDGNYLDKKKSKGLTAELLTYNADLSVLAYSQITFKWKKDGAIAGELNKIGTASCMPNQVRTTGNTSPVRTTGNNCPNGSTYIHSTMAALALNAKFQDCELFLSPTAA
jgi:hypothetical protein